MHRPPLPERNGHGPTRARIGADWSIWTTDSSVKLNPVNAPDPETDSAPAPEPAPFLSGQDRFVLDDGVLPPFLAGASESEETWMPATGAEPESGYFEGGTRVNGKGWKGQPARAIFSARRLHSKCATRSRQ
jgi:hypothetical protein